MSFYNIVAEKSNSAEDTVMVINDKLKCDPLKVDLTFEDKCSGFFYFLLISNVKVGHIGPSTL